LRPIFGCEEVSVAGLFVFDAGDSISATDFVGVGLEEKEEAVAVVDWRLVEFAINLELRMSANETISMSSSFGSELLRMADGFE
jgi:hypothetical protein